MNKGPIAVEIDSKLWQLLRIKKWVENSAAAPLLCSDISPASFLKSGLLLIPILFTRTHYSVSLYPAEFPFLLDSY